MEASDKTFYEQVFCGCSKQVHINIPHWLVTDAIANGLTLQETADKLAGQPQGRVQAVSTAVAAMFHTKRIEQIPAAWLAPQQ